MQTGHQTLLGWCASRRPLVSSIKGTSSCRCALGSIFRFIPTAILCCNSIGDCGVPASPTDGTVAYTTTTEGSLATFQCSAGLVPVVLMIAVCENSGGGAHWSPDPGDLSCSKPSFLFTRFPVCLVPKPWHITVFWGAWLGNKNKID